MVAATSPQANALRAMLCNEGRAAWFISRWSTMPTSFKYVIFASTDTDADAKYAPSLGALTLLKIYSISLDLISLLISMTWRRCEHVNHDRIHLT